MSDVCTIHPDYSQTFKEMRLSSLRELLDVNDGQLVGEHGPRICRKILAKNSQILYVRQEKRIPFGELLQDIVHGYCPKSRAEKMLNAESIFQSADIETPPIIAMMAHRVCGIPRSAGVVQMSAQGEDIYHTLLSFGRPNKLKTYSTSRNQLFAGLGELLRKLWDAKINWHDLSAKHIFVNQSSGDSSWKYSLIDTERASKHASNHQMFLQTKQLLLSLKGVVRRSDLVRIAKGFAQVQSNSPKAYRNQIPHGEKLFKMMMTEISLRTFLPENELLPEEELFERVSGAVINMRFKKSLNQLGLLGRDALLSFSEGTSLHKPGLGRRFRMSFTVDMDGSKTTFYLKRVFRPKLKDQLDRILCGTLKHSSCWHERYMIKLLGKKRIPVPAVIAYTEKMRFGFERASVLVTKSVAGESLEKFVPKNVPPQSSGKEFTHRREMIVRLAALVGRFHRQGFCHRDLYLSHIFISFNQNGLPVFSLIDLARCFKPKLFQMRWIIKDLAALSFSSPSEIISKSDRMRFLKIYLSVLFDGKANKSLMSVFSQKIVRKSDKIKRHNEKRP